MSLQCAFSLQGVTKEFPGVRALDNASLDVRIGEVHGLVGENGAGKSTVVKVLAGVYQPDAGLVKIGGETLSPLTPDSVHAAGIRFVHQELHLIPHFTVAESVFLGQERSHRLGLDNKAMRENTKAFLQSMLGVDIPSNRLIRDLTTAERKLVQIARALIDEVAKVVVFDEPTAPLASDEIETVMSAIRRLAEQDIAILYVSHYLSEITDICDRVTVFRQGKTVKVFDTITEHSGRDLVYAMVGRNIADMFPAKGDRAKGPGLEVTGLSDGSAFADISLSVEKGEIFGIAGLIGSGREELIDTIYGLRKAQTGTFQLEGEPLIIKSAAQAVDAGIVLVPRDRRHDGLVLSMTMAENVTLATLDQNASFGLENRRLARERTEAQITALDIRPPNPDTVTRLLSGGNQQKVILARWMVTSARVFIFDDPTIGVDVGAKSEIYQLINDLAASGACVIVSSSDPVELQGICDRIAIMMRGEIIGELQTEELSVDELVSAITGAKYIKNLTDVN
ncbi:MAG: sugar ABC transporter ATP-binding protein [Aestuariivita sp.]|nr:sugar ABC transporter ATP-binding protein [Aestuariivita sp.]MCY4345267.1 sugar ABC transporter ATP-binding protein [Aestuariivita sp.]